MRRHWLLLLSTFSAITILVAAAIGDKRITELETEDQGGSLSAILRTTHQAIESWAAEEMETARIWASDPEVVRLVEELLTMTHSREALVQARAQRRIRSRISVVLRERGYQGFFIINRDNISLASTRDANTGTENLLVEQSERLHRIWNGESCLTLPQRSDVPLPDDHGVPRDGVPTMFVGAPVKDASGKIIAALAFRINPGEHFTTILQQGRAGESGETYAFNRDGTFISRSRFQDQLVEIGLLSPGEDSILSVAIRDPGVDLSQGEAPLEPMEEHPLTLMAKSAIAGHDGINVKGYRDYRGVVVIGAWLWDDDLGIGLTTEVDVEEAFTTLHALRSVGWVLALLSVCLLLLLTVVYSVNRRRIQESETRYRSLHTSANDAIFLMEDGVFTECNPKTLEMFACSKEQIIGQPPHRFSPKKQPDGVASEIKARELITAALTVEPQTFEWQHIRYDETPFDAEVGLSAVEIGGRQSLLAIVRDVTARKQAERTSVRAQQELHRHLEQLEDIVQERTASLRKLSTAVDHSASAIVITNRHGAIEYVNPKFCETTGYSEEEVLGENPRILKGGDQPVEFYQDLWEQILSGKEWRGEFQNRTKSGELVWDLSSISPIFDEGDENTHFVAVKEDITERKRLQDELTQQAHFDRLTGLPNRVLFFNRLDQVLALSKRKERSFCLLFLDLDGFKAVNDTYGHEIGDALLVEVARRLEVVLRKSDTAARMGGDEFTMILTDLDDLAEAATVAKRILEAIAIPFEFAGHTCHVGTSIGIAGFPTDGVDAKALMASADEAMYQVKRSGKNDFQFATSPPEQDLGK